MVSHTRRLDLDLNLESQTQIKNIPVVLSSYLIKVWGNSVKGGFLNYDWYVTIYKVQRIY